MYPPIHFLPPGLLYTVNIEDVNIEDEISNKEAYDEKIQENR